MKTVRATMKITPRISFTCPDCGERNYYTKFGYAPETVECSACRAEFVAAYGDRNLITAL